MVVEEYLSSRSGVCAVRDMEEILRSIHRYVPVAIELVKLLPEHEDLNVRINTVIYGLRLIYDLRVEQCNVIKELVREEYEKTNEPSWEDLPF